MLTDNDFHYLSGFLYLVANSEPVSVILGERVHDIASDTNRDVDIVVIQAGDVGFIGAEVKNHSRPLDAAQIEAICLKLEDMPSIREGHVISTSGFTTPAVRKAKAHDLNTLTMKQGSVPPFSTINISKIDSMNILHHSWIEGPVSWFVPKDEIPVEYDRLINDSTKIMWTDRNIDLKAQQFADGIAKSLKGWFAPKITGQYPVDHFIPLKGTPHIELNNQLFSLIGVQAKGIVQVTEEKMPLDQSRYLEDSNGNIFAGAAMLEWRDHLTGVCVSDKTQNLVSFLLPDNIRKIRPHKVTL